MSDIFGECIRTRYNKYLSFQLHTGMVNRNIEPLGLMCICRIVTGELLHCSEYGAVRKMREKENGKEIILLSPRVQQSND